MRALKFIWTVTDQDTPTNSLPEPLLVHSSKIVWQAKYEQLLGQALCIAACVTSQTGAPKTFYHKFMLPHNDPIDVGLHSIHGAKIKHQKITFRRANTDLIPTIFTFIRLRAILPRSRT